jgi:hypothetical protein
MAAPGFVTLICWDFPTGERLSHRGMDWEPRRDWGHPLWRHRSLVDVPESLADEIVRLTPGVERLE